MRTALIGHTGFVGGNLLRQTEFTQHYNSKNIGSIAGHAFDQLVCCGAPAEKWKANQNPTADWENLERLMTCLESVTARQVILISTVDVFDAPLGVDEDSAIDPLRVGPYGKHRYQLEKFITGRFNSLVVRLPGLFGPGLKKNVIFDFLHNNQVERIHSEARFQFYDLNNIWGDIQRALHAKLRLVHFATEPVSVAEVASQGFGRRFDNKTAGIPAVYDFRTKHDGLYGSSGGYVNRKQAVLQAIREFVAVTQGRKAMRLAISNIAWPAEAEAMVADCLAGMGAEGVEVAPTKVWPRPLQATDAEVSAYRLFWERAGLPIVALQALLFERPALRLFADPAQRTEMLDYLTGMIRLASRLGASTLVFGSPKNRARGDLSPAQAAELAVPFFRELGRIASAEHTDFCIEPNPTAYGCDFIIAAGEGIDLVNAVDQPGFGLHLDAAGMKLSEDPPAEVFPAAKPCWRHFHVSEPFLNPVGQGGMDHSPYAAALRQSGYDRWVSIEMKVPQNGFKLSDVEQALHHVQSTYMAAA